MNNRGFTLVEVIGIVLILSTIFLVSFPSLMGITKKADEDKYDDMVENLCLAGESYIYSNMNTYEDFISKRKKINISVQTLINYGNVDVDKIDNAAINSTLIYTVNSDLSLACTYNKR